MLAGPGTVSSPRHVVSLPYTVQVTLMNVSPGSEVRAGDEIGRVHSPEQDNIVATYMRSLSDIANRRAELRIKGRVAQESLEAAHAYRDLTQDAVIRLNASSHASTVFRLDILRERAAAQKAVASQEAEVAEAITQLADLEEFRQQIRERLDQVEECFAGGAVRAPVGGLISTNLAYAGQSLVAGTAIAEILDPGDIYVDWNIPNERLADPKIGKEVFVLFGGRRIPGKISEILRVSDVYGGRGQIFARERSATQLARIRFDPNVVAPPLNSTVRVHMFYADLTARFAGWLVDMLGVD